VAVGLVPGRNTIAVKATNFAGNATTAIVTVTYKPLPCVVPKLRGKTIAAARLVLQARDCRAGRIVRIRSKGVRKGHIVATTPKPGTKHRPFYKVRIFVSRGR
jgi:beta-lactam-binding protein with PASTA domain